MLKISGQEFVDQYVGQKVALTKEDHLGINAGQLEMEFKLSPDESVLLMRRRYNGISPLLKEKFETEWSKASWMIDKSFIFFKLRLPDLPDEIKCPIKREIKHEIPSYYYPQVQICMEVLDIPKCYFIQYKPEMIYQDAILDVIEIPRSKEWFATHLDTLDTFWKTVLENRLDPESYKLTLPKPRVKKAKKEVIEVEQLPLFQNDDED